MLKKWVWLSLLPSLSFATVNVYLSTSAPTQLQNDFIAMATTYFNGNLVSSPYFSGTYSFTISGKRAAPIISVSSPVYTATAVDQCMAYGWSFGADYERQDNIKIAEGLYSDVLVTHACGGLISPTTDYSEAFLRGCQTGYSVIKSTITLKNFSFPPP